MMQSSGDEVELAGGNMNGGVVRVGDTVRRAASPQSATIQRLLAHVRECGVTWVPEPLGFDELGREVLRFIPGEVVHGEPDFRGKFTVLGDVARALRQWHDATLTFPRSASDVWFTLGEPDGADSLVAQSATAHGVIAHAVIAHNDFAPYNHVFSDGKFLGVIDFDVCSPASREWDLAWTLYRYVYLPAFAAFAPTGGAPWARLSPPQTQRIRTECTSPAAHFTSEYGNLASGAIEKVIPDRLDTMAAWCARQPSADQRQWGLMYSAHSLWMSDVSADRPH